MPVKYLYFDDEGPDKIDAYIRIVQSQADEQLVIEHRPPRRYDKQIEVLRGLSDEEVNGVILDFRLDMKSNEIEGGKERAQYRAATIAQEMRTLGTEGKIKEMPVVLWSLSRRYRESYSPDETAHDLFDLTSIKDQLETAKGAHEMATRLVSLASGYEELREIIDQNRKRKRFTYKLLGFDENPGFLDPRIVTYFDNQSALPTHEYARFLLRKMLEATGPLVNESILAARLGIDRDRSEGWNHIRDLLAEFEYDGPFCKGWPRWWWPEVDDWWYAEAADESLKRLPAESRVEFLSRSTGISELVPAEPIEAGYSTRYWTVCQVYDQPLDPVDGLRAKARNLEPWMDRPYLSKKAALRGKGEVDPLDDGRLQRLKRRN